MSKAVKAFSLIELLIVIAMIFLVVTLATVSLGSISAANKITQGSEIVLGALTNARQLAATKWRDVEVRIITVQNTQAVFSTFQPRAIQLLEVSEQGLKPIAKVRMLPENIIITPEISLSTIMDLQATNASSTNNDLPLPGVGFAYEYRAFRFRPDGSSNINLLLPNQNRFHLTIVAENATVAKDSPPPNFATIQITPSTGAVHLYRP